MSPAVQKLVRQAIMNYLNGDMELFDRWMQMAVTECVQLKEQDRLHATVAEILEAKRESVLC